MPTVSICMLWSVAWSKLNARGKNLGIWVFGVEVFIYPFNVFFSLTAYPSVNCTSTASFHRHLSSCKLGMTMLEMEAGGIWIFQAPRPHSCEREGELWDDRSLLVISSGNHPVCCASFVRIWMCFIVGCCLR